KGRERCRRTHRPAGAAAAPAPSPPRGSAPPPTEARLASAPTRRDRLRLGRVPRRAPPWAARASVRRCDPTDRRSPPGNRVRAEPRRLHRTFRPPAALRRPGSTRASSLRRPAPRDALDAAASVAARRNPRTPTRRGLVRTARRGRSSRRLTAPARHGFIDSRDIDWGAPRIDLSKSWRLVVTELGKSAPLAQARVDAGNWMTALTLARKAI